jgi:hypothetical protein
LHGANGLIYRGVLSFGAIQLVLVGEHPSCPFSCVVVS